MFQLSNIFEYVKGNPPGHIIMYAMSPSRIETLEKGTVLMGNLEKVGWVVLKSGNNITPYCDLENKFCII